MWKPNQPENSATGPGPTPPSPAPPAAESESSARSGSAKTDQSVIGKGLFLKGEITGSDSLFIDGRVEGAINLPGSRVTLGRNGQVGANITAREVVVSGKVRGNVTATDRIDIRAEGALNGDVSAARISIEDGAYFKGGIDIRKPEPKESRPMGIAVAAPAAPKPAAAPVTPAAATTEPTQS
jgi:cytoskeletal protein CcmA (bactofilin family)